MKKVSIIIISSALIFLSCFGLVKDSDRGPIIHPINETVSMGPIIHPIDETVSMGPIIHPINDIHNC